MFENLVSSYPKRVDLWSVYVDMMAKNGNINTIRLVKYVARIYLSLKLNTIIMNDYNTAHCPNHYHTPSCVTTHCPYHYCSLSHSRPPIIPSYHYCSLPHSPPIAPIITAHCHTPHPLPLSLLLIATLATHCPYHYCPLPQSLPHSLLCYHPLPLSLLLIATLPATHYP